jgi:hypothetical protein
MLVKEISNDHGGFFFCFKYNAMIMVVVQRQARVFTRHTTKYIWVLLLYKLYMALLVTRGKKCVANYLKIKSFT